MVWGWYGWLGLVGGCLLVGCLGVGVYFGFWDGLFVVRCGW